MNTDEIYEKLNEIFRDVFDDNTIVVTENTNSEDIDDWDSLENINLIVAIEKNFNIKLHLGEVQALNNVGDMAQMIQEKLNR